MGFSKDFVWGTASAAYQIEGGAFEDGKGLSTWDRMANTPGRIYNNHNANVTCDSYHRLNEDIDALKAVGVKAYRFSLSWPRLIPEGTGKTNPKGFDYYDRLIDSLLENNITPYVTLFHWDYPLELFYKGGLLNRDSSKWFAEYTERVVERYSDRVSNWMTQNEPVCYTYAAIYLGGMAPGIRLSYPDFVRCWHHNLVAHGEAVKVIRSEAKTKPNVSIVGCGDFGVPETETPENIEATRFRMFERPDKNAEYCEYPELFDPIFFGKYPMNYEQHLPSYWQDDMKTIMEPIDFIAMNIYGGFRVRKPVSGNAPFEVLPQKTGRAESNMPMAFEPDALYWGTKLMYERYKKPVMITENGISVNDWIYKDGKVHDASRIDYIAQYLTSLKRSADDGTPVKGYFYWSLLDNFEWTAGFSKRFGLYHVDFETLKRTQKDSALYYRDIILSNGENI